jgi:hypothetical protein
VDLWIRFSTKCPRCLTKGFLSSFERNVKQYGSLVKFSFIMSGTCSNSCHNYPACDIVQIEH